MRLGILAFLLGILYCQTLTELPDIIWFTIFLPLGIFPRFRLLFLFVLGLAYAIWRADIILAQKLPIELVGKNITITGTVIDLPSQYRFKFYPKVSPEWPNPGLIYLKYPSYKKLSVRPGQQWKFRVRLKQIRTIFNSDSFNSEKWLFRHRIMANGSISLAKLLQEPSLFNINDIRYSLINTIKQELSEYQSVGIIIALALGDKNSIPAQQKKILRHTNISHLIVISGLHIGFIAWLIFIISHSLWRYMGKVVLFPASRFAALASILFATSYALLAGFSLPTQRALIMLIVALSGIIFNYKITLPNIFAIALLLILIWDPLTVLSIEFWLSFGTVAIIFYSLTERKQQNLTTLENNALSIIRIQIVITLGLFPVLFFIFGYVSLSSFLANMIAIPWVSFIVIPCTLLGIILSPLINGLFDTTNGLLHMAAFTFDAILIPMAWLSNLEWNLWYLQPQLWTVITAMIGIFILFLPSGFPARWLGFIWLLPLFTDQSYNSSILKQGEILLTLLDVGQGLAVVIRTKNHGLIYDTGPNEYIGRTVIIPFLQAKKSQPIDKIIVSHADKDHSGGFAALMDGVIQQDFTEILTSSNKIGYPKYNIKYCQTGMEWLWDGVKFQILHPPANFTANNTNDKSCVLKISTNNNSILLPGDIGTDIEFDLISIYGSKLKADILVAPHHGSGNSSSISFINAIRPKIVLFSTGYNNSYNHPRKNITQRYEKYKAITMDTSESGAINLRLTTDGIFKPSKDRNKRYWYK